MERLTPEYQKKWDEIVKQLDTELGKAKIEGNKNFVFNRYEYHVSAQNFVVNRKY